MPKAFFIALTVTLLTFFYTRPLLYPEGCNPDLKYRGFPFASWKYKPVEIPLIGDVDLPLNVTWIWTGFIANFTLYLSVVYLMFLAFSRRDGNG